MAWCTPFWIRSKFEPPNADPYRNHIYCVSIWLFLNVNHSRPVLALQKRHQEIKNASGRRCVFFQWFRGKTPVQLFPYNVKCTSCLLHVLIHTKLSSTALVKKSNSAYLLHVVADFATGWSLVFNAGETQANFANGVWGVVIFAKEGQYYYLLLGKFHLISLSLVAYCCLNFKALWIALHRRRLFMHSNAVLWDAACDAKHRAFFMLGLLLLALIRKASPYRERLTFM